MPARGGAGRGGRGAPQGRACQATTHPPPRRTVVVAVVARDRGEAAERIVLRVRDPARRKFVVHLRRGRQQRARLPAAERAHAAHRAEVVVAAQTTRGCKGAGGVRAGGGRSRKVAAARSRACSGHRGGRQPGQRLTPGVGTDREERQQRGVLHGETAPPSPRLASAPGSRLSAAARPPGAHCSRAGAARLFGAGRAQRRAGLTRGASGAPNFCRRRGGGGGGRWRCWSGQRERERTRERE